MKPMLKLLILFLAIIAKPTHAEIYPSFSKTSSQPFLFDIVDAINSAKKSINIAIYHFDYPPLEESLVKAAARAVDIKLIVDKNSQGIKEPDPKYRAEQELHVRITFKAADK